MKSNNPLVKLESYKRMRARRKEIMKSIENEIYYLEKDYVQVEFRGVRRYATVRYGLFPAENKVRCSRLRGLYTKLEYSSLRLKRKINDGYDRVRLVTFNVSCWKK